MKLKAFLSFAGVGAVGFMVDAGLLLAITKVFGLSPILARLPSFMSAATITWILNSRITFGVHTHGFGSWAKYVVVNAIGFCLNYLIYAMLVWHLHAQPLVAIAAASAIALFFNFLGTDRFAFSKHEK